MSLKLIGKLLLEILWCSYSFSAELKMTDVVAHSVVISLTSTQRQFTIIEIHKKLSYLSLQNITKARRKLLIILPVILLCNMI